VITSGFEEFRIAGRCEVFDDVPKPSSAVEFGAIGIWFAARKPSG
jgi:hypothetical protein